MYVGIRNALIRQAGDTRFDRPIRNGLGMKLLLDPGVDAVLHHGIDITRPRPEREPVQHMQRALAVGKFVVRGSSAGQQRKSDEPGDEWDRTFHVAWTNGEG